MTEKQIGGNGMAKRQPTVLRVPDGRGGFAAYRIQPNSECRRPRARQSEHVG